MIFKSEAPAKTNKNRVAKIWNFACQSMFVVVTKDKSILDRQNSKYLSSNVCPFGRSLTEKF